MTHTAEGLALSADGSLAYVACGQDGLKVVNLAIGIEVGSLDTDGYAWNVTRAASGNRLYVADGRDGGTLVVDISTPTQPRVVGMLDGSVDARGVAVAPTGNKVVVADFAGGTLILDTTRSNSTGIARTTGGAKRAVPRPDGAFTFVADNSAGLAIVQTGTIGTERVVGTVGTGRFAVDVAVSANGRYACVADTTTGLVVVDATTPANPVKTRVLADPINPTAVATSADGRHLFVADRFGGMVIYSLANPAIPQKVKAVGGVWPVADVAVSANGQLAAVAAATNGIQLFNVAAPTAAASLATIALGGEAATGVAIAPDSATAYAVTESGSLRVISLAVPAAPTQLASLDLGAAANGITICPDGFRAYVATNAGVIAVDISQPGRPLLLGTMPTQGGPQSVVATADKRLLIAANAGGLVVQNVASPAGFSLASDAIAARLRGTLESRGSLPLSKTAAGAWQAGASTISAAGSLAAIEAAWQFLEAEALADSNTLFARHRSGALHRLVADQTWQLLGFCRRQQGWPSAATAEAIPSPPTRPGTTMRPASTLTAIRPAPP